MLLLGRVVAALISGLLLAQAYGLNPFWPLAWIAPIPLLIAAIGASRLGGFAYGALAGAVSMAFFGPYFLEIGGVAPVVIITLAKAIVLGAMTFAVRAASRHLPTWAAMFVFSALMAGFETFLAFVSPHGSAGAIAYSQMDFIPLIQIASLGGSPAITFVISLFASAVAFLIAKRAIFTFAAPALIVAAVLGFGYWRLAQAPEAETARVALLAGDQFAFIPDDWRSVWAAYTPQIERAADEDRRIIVLPEKIAHLAPEERGAAIEQLAEIARRRDLLLIVGVDDETDEGRFNRAFALGPNAAQTYDKRHVIPGFESHFDLGAANLIFDHAGMRVGVAVCKDMDFPALGRGYAGIDVMLVPAWDFTEDAWIHSRIAILRGVESGYAIVRSARSGVLTVSDAYGRVTAEAPSGPQTAYNAEVPLGGPGPTLYARIGDAFGWACAALALLLIGWGALRKRAGKSHANAD